MINGRRMNFRPHTVRQQTNIIVTDNSAQLVQLELDDARKGLLIFPQQIDPLPQSNIRIVRRAQKYS